MVGVRTWTDDGIWFIILISRILKPATSTSGRNSKPTRLYTDEQIALLCKQNVEDLNHTPDASGVRYVRSNKKPDAPPPSPAVIAAIERIRRQPHTVFPNQGVGSGNGGMAGNMARNGSSSTRNINIQQRYGPVSSATMAPVVITKGQNGMQTHFGNLGMNPPHQQGSMEQQRSLSFPHGTMNDRSPAHGHEMGSNSSSFQPQMQGFNGGISGGPSWTAGNMGYPKNPPDTMASGGRSNIEVSSNFSHSTSYGQPRQTQLGQSGRPFPYRQHHQRLNSQSRAPHMTGPWRSQDFTAAVSNPQPDASYMTSSCGSQDSTATVYSQQTEASQIPVQWTPEHLDPATAYTPLFPDFNDILAAQFTSSGILQTTFQNPGFSYTNPHDNQPRLHHSETQDYNHMPNNFVNPGVDYVQPNFMSQQPHSSFQNLRKHQRDLDEYWQPSMNSNENFERDIKRHKVEGVAELGQMDRYLQEENNGQASLQQRPTNSQELHTRDPTVFSTISPPIPASGISLVTQSRVTLSNPSAPDGEDRLKYEFRDIYGAEMLLPSDGHSSSQHNDGFNALGHAELSQGSTLLGENQSQFTDNLPNPPNVPSFEEWSYDQIFAAIEAHDFSTVSRESFEEPFNEPSGQQDSGTGKI
ncbi:hypothetical protein DID88_008627 [Monilinia fructigena]|uniref:Uncharacterized protein n=1 Tax=Monilinia fructigena TaxID=38457 RepID=A0A395J5W8_9HELO|nr:hypothetical protein DID88_008627 [Monilinia fructigena]